MWQTGHNSETSKTLKNNKAESITHCIKTAHKFSEIKKLKSIAASNIKILNEQAEFQLSLVDYYYTEP